MRLHSDRAEQMHVRIEELEAVGERYVALLAALDALEQEMRTPRPGYNVTDTEWADRLAAILNEHAPR